MGRTIYPWQIRIGSHAVLIAIVLLAPIPGSGTTSAAGLTPNASTEFVQLTRQAVNTALAANASKQDIKRAEELLFGVGWMALYGNTGERPFMQKWYLAMPAGGQDFSRLNSLREVPNFKLDTAVSLAPSYLTLVKQRVDLTTGANSTADDFRTGEASLIALGWMALYGNDADSKALARRLSEAAFKRDADYHSHTHTAYFEMLNLHRFAMAPALPYESPPILPQAVRPPVAQQWATLVTGTSEINAQNETRKGTFEIFGDEQARLIRMDVEGMSFELTVDDNDTGGNTGTGQLSPCEGSYCPCKMTELEGRVEGSCDDPDYPELGVLSFTLCLGGETACAHRDVRSAPIPAPPRAVQQPAVRPPPIVVQRPVVRPPPQPPRAVQQPVEPQWEMMAKGRGKIIAQGGTYEANFQILGDGEIARSIKLAYGGLSQEIKIADEDAGGGNATGQMSPCNGGNCPCNMAEVEDRIEGSCRNTAFPDLGDMRFILCLGDPSACQQQVVEKPVVRPPPPRVVQQPAVRPPPPVIVQQPAVRPPPPRRNQQPARPPAYKPPPPAKPQLVKIASGNGEFNDSQANFEFWGIDGQPTVLKIRARGGPWEVGFDMGANNQEQIMGRLTPCRGGVCACELWEEGENYLQGSCTIGPGQESFMSINITAQY